MAVPSRPFADSQVSPYLSVSQIQIFELEYLEAAVRDLTDSANMLSFVSRWRLTAPVPFSTSRIEPELMAFAELTGRSRATRRFAFSPINFDVIPRVGLSAASSMSPQEDPFF